MSAVCVVITALNEADSVGALVYYFRGRGYDVVVVDDGSTDQTGEIAARNGASVIRHNAPQGISAALVEAWKFGMMDGSHRRFIQIDAGGSHDPEQADRLLSVKADIVIGSRFVPCALYIGNKRRALMSRIAARMCNFAKAKNKLSDWTSGYRVFSRETIGRLCYQHYSSRGHAWQIEVLTRAIRYGMSIKEAPITYVAGRSSLNIKSIDEAFCAWLELMFS